MLFRSDFNVGESSDDAMERLIDEERKSGVFLTVLGYGMGNYKDNKMQKLADKVDLVAQTDRRFFERFPHRQHRVRLASRAEIGQNEIIEGGPVWLPEGLRVFTAVRNIAPGVRMRLFLRAPEGSETDLDEQTALAIYEAAETPRSRKIEAELRKAAEARG